jgi:hypothetical protein
MTPEGKAIQEMDFYALGEVARDLGEARRKASDSDLPSETREHYKNVVKDFEAERERLRKKLIPEDFMSASMKPQRQ